MTKGENLLKSSRMPNRDKHSFVCINIYILLLTPLSSSKIVTSNASRSACLFKLLGEEEERREEEVRYGRKEELNKGVIIPVL